MADNRGGRKDPDFKVRPPEATGERSDMMRGLPYGERKDIIAAQQAAPLPRESNQPPSGGSPSRSRGGGRGINQLLRKHGSLKPDEPLEAGRDRFANQRPIPASRRTLEKTLDVIIQESDVVPVGLMQLREMVADVR